MEEVLCIALQCIQGLVKVRSREEDQRLMRGNTEETHLELES